MNCQGCGHNFPNTLTRCPRCKLASNRRGQRSSDSRLIEFPKKSRLAQQNEPETALPAWRVELNEKVRAIQARRNNPALQTGAVETTQINPAETVAGAVAAAVRQAEARPRNKLAREIQAVVAEPQKHVSARIDREQPEPVRPAQRSSDHIVEAALTRVRRASENASRAALPKIEPVRPAAQAAAIMVDKEATARALEPEAERSRHVRSDMLPLPEAVAPPLPIPRTEVAQGPSAITRKIEPKLIIEPEPSYSSHSVDAGESPTVLTLDEIEPLDYLEAEIRKVDRVLSAELSKTESLSFFTHVVINLIDLFVIAITSLPFVALVGLHNGAFTAFQTREATLGIIALVALFYLSLTQSLCGRTFGMMFTNTRVVNAQTAEAISLQSALFRSFGYMVAVAPACLGLIWAAFNRQRRGWHDYISGSQVVGDF